MSKPSVERLSAEQVAEFSSLNPAEVARIAGINAPLEVTMAPGRPGGMFRRAPLTTAPKPRTAWGKRRAARREKREHEAHERAKARKNQNEARSARMREYTGGHFWRDSIIGTTGVGVAIWAGAMPYLTAPLATVHSAIISVTGAWFAAEVVAGLASVGALVLATKIVPVLAPITNWLIKKIYRHTAGRVFHWVSPKYAEKFDAWVGKQNEKLENFIYTTLNTLTGPLKLGDWYKWANDGIKRATDYLDGKKTPDGKYA
jgi:hypothetical protein